MSKLLSEEQATGKAKTVYAEIKEAFGMVPNLFLAQGAVDPDWLELNWQREKQVMLSEGALDRKTKELLAMTVALVSDSDYCALAHEAMAKMAGASEAEIDNAKQVIELFTSFSAIAKSLRVPCDLRPEMVTDENRA